MQCDCCKTQLLDEGNIAEMIIIIMFIDSKTSKTGEF